MRLMFVYFLYEYAGSAQDIHHYSRIAPAMGHEIVVYGPTGGHPCFNFSLDAESADAVIFIFEWTTQMRYGDRLDIARLVSKFPRKRRVVIDCDGNYNDVISVGGDYNHGDVAASRRWIDVCDCLADKICQPTLHPLRSNVRPFLFYGYNPRSEVGLDFSGKEYGMMYVGHSKFRWSPLHQVLEAVEPVRPHVGRIALVGDGWDGLPPWAVPMKMEDAYRTDQAYLRKLNVEIIPPIPFERVISWMSKAIFNPVTYRPLFGYLGLVSPRMFETPAANTIPLFVLDERYVREIYGESAVGLMLADNPSAKILDIVHQPERYMDIVMVLREHLAKNHSHAARLQQLIEIVES